MMNDEEIKTVFVLKYGRPDLHEYDWMLSLPDEIFNLLINDAHTFNGTNHRHVHSINLFMKFNSMSIIHDAPKCFEAYVFKRYIKNIRKQERLLRYKKIKEFLHL